MKRLENRIEERKSRIESLLNEVENGLISFNQEIKTYSNMAFGFGMTGSAIRNNTGELELF